MPSAEKAEQYAGVGQAGVAAMVLRLLLESSCMTRCDAGRMRGDESLCVRSQTLAAGPAPARVLLSPGGNRLQK